jgi:hypothetical protein
MRGAMPSARSRSSTRYGLRRGALLIRGSRGSRRSSTRVPHRIRDTMQPPAPGGGSSDRSNVGGMGNQRAAPLGPAAQQNEGVGEHVRTRFHSGVRSPVKLRIAKDPHRTKKTCFFCRTEFRKSELLGNAIQPFDLMSRRHPLSSQEPPVQNLLVGSRSF